MTNPSTLRGKLECKITTSCSQIEAGKEFSISVEIRNPYDIPVKIKRVSAKFPTEFVDVNREKLLTHENQLKTHLKELLKEEIPAIAIAEEKKKDFIKSITKDLIRILPFGGLFSAATEAANFMLATNVASSATMNRALEEISHHDVKSIIDTAKSESEPESTIKQELIKLIQGKVENVKNSFNKEIDLLPGSSTMHIFTIKTNKTLLFPPSTYNLFIEIEYDTDSCINRDVIEYSLSISSSIITLITGAAIGSLLGCFVRDIFNEKTIISACDNPSASACIFIILLFIANMIMGIMAVIIFKRKKDVQPIMAVEDLWGGLLVGFLVGYGGKAFMSELLPNNQPATTELNQMIPQ